MLIMAIVAARRSNAVVINLPLLLFRSFPFIRASLIEPKVLDSYVRPRLLINTNSCDHYFNVECGET